MSAQTTSPALSEIRSTYRGSEQTRKCVEDQVREKYGADVAAKFDPYTSAMTMRAWNRAGYRIKKGAKALHSFTMVEVENPKGEVTRKYKKSVFLFHRLEVEPMNATGSSESKPV